MREEGFSPSNFSELKEELRTQHKETKNLEKRVEELITRIINAEKAINEQTEMKTMTREICDKCTSFSNWLDQLEERVSMIENQMNEMKWEEKSRISYPAKLSFIREGEIKSFTDKQMLRDFVTTRPALQEILKEEQNMESNNKYQPLQKHAKM